jgi:hypothetical protein
MQNCNCEKTLEKNKEIFEKYYKNEQNKILNYDGYICEEEYKTASKKIVFILKESYTDDLERFKTEEKSSITYQLCKTISNGYSFGEETNSNMFNVLGIMANYLLTGNKEIPENHYDKQKNLLKVGYLNISKTPLVRKENENKESNDNILKEQFDKYKDLLKAQITELNPDIVVVCGKIGNEGIFGKVIMEIFNEKLDEKDQGEKEIDLNGKKVKFLFSYHPATPGKTYEDFINSLEEKLNNLQK